MACRWPPQTRKQNDSIAEDVVESLPRGAPICATVKGKHLIHISHLGRGNDNHCNLKRLNVERIHTSFPLLSPCFAANMDAVIAQMQDALEGQIVSLPGHQVVSVILIGFQDFEGQRVSELVCTILLCLTSVRHR